MTTFDVLVGPERKHFTLDPKIFCSRSEFFKCSRSSRWKKDPTKPTEMPENDSDALTAYLRCVANLSGVLADYRGGVSPNEQEATAGVIVKTDALADRLLDFEIATRTLRDPGSLFTTPKFLYDSKLIQRAYKRRLLEVCMVPLLLKKHLRKPEIFDKGRESCEDEKEENKRGGGY